MKETEIKMIKDTDLKIMKILKAIKVAEACFKKKENVNYLIKVE